MNKWSTSPYEAITPIEDMTPMPRKAVAPTPGPYKVENIGGVLWIGSEPDNPNYAFGRLIANMNQSQAMGVKDIRQVEADARLLAEAWTMRDLIEKFAAKGHADDCPGRVAHTRPGIYLGCDCGVESARALLDRIKGGTANG